LQRAGRKGLDDHEFILVSHRLRRPAVG
jgi:hypothetical protein